MLIFHSGPSANEMTNANFVVRDSFCVTRPLEICWCNQIPKIFIGLLGCLFLRALELGAQFTRNQFSAFSNSVFSHFSSERSFGFHKMGCLCFCGEQMIE